MLDTSSGLCSLQAVPPPRPLAAGVVGLLAKARTGALIRCGRGLRPKKTFGGGGFLLLRRSTVMLTRLVKVFGAVVLLALLGVALAQSSDGPKTGDLKEAAFAGKAVHVVLKGQIQLQAKNSTFLFLEQPQIRTFGNGSFVTGRSIEHGRQIWVPLSEVTAIEEFAEHQRDGQGLLPAATSRKVVWRRLGQCRRTRRCTATGAAFLFRATPCRCSGPGG